MARRRSLHDTVARDLRQDGHRAMLARFPSVCPCGTERCRELIEEGNCIVLDEGRWIRSDCFTRKYHDNKTVLPRVMANPYARNVWAGVRPTAARY